MKVLRSVPPFNGSLISLSLRLLRPRHRRPSCWEPYNSRLGEQVVQLRSRSFIQIDCGFGKWTETGRRRNCRNRFNQAAANNRCLTASWTRHDESWHSKKSRDRNGDRRFRNLIDAGKPSLGSLLLSAHTVKLNDLYI